MQGHGSVNVGDESLLEDTFMEYTLERLQEIPVNPDAVPLWKDFTDTVARSSIREFGH